MSADNLNNVEVRRFMRGTPPNEDTSATRLELMKKYGISRTRADSVMKAHKDLN